MNTGVDMRRTPSDITLVGCGYMGSALLRTWLDFFSRTRFCVIEPTGLPAEFENHSNIIHVTDAAAGGEDISTAGVIVLAVKPQIMSQACAALRPFVSGNSVVLSIAAGQTLQNFQTLFGATQPVIRAMPNTPAAIGKGMAVAVAGVNVTPDQKEAAAQILQSTGLLEWVDDEALLDAVTAVSGSGPAYVFYLMEVLARAGEKAGLPPKLAKTLARQTVVGSAALAAQNPEKDPADLRRGVTSPGGTTEAALSILMNGEIEDLFVRAVEAARKRSEELKS
jgi:pyrroline-5-carboxylate reductase